MPLILPLKLHERTLPAAFVRLLRTAEALGLLNGWQVTCLKNWKRGVELLTESGSIPRCRAYHFCPPRIKIAALSNSFSARDVPPKVPQCYVESKKERKLIESACGVWLGRKSTAVGLSHHGWRENSCLTCGGLARLGRTVMVPALEFNPMSLDHPIKCFAIYAQQARGGLLVAAGVLQHPGDVTAFYF